MKLKLIAEQSDQELQKLIETSHIELADTTTQLKTQKTPNVKRILAIRKTIARALTISRQRTLTALESQSINSTKASITKRGQSNG